MDVAWLILDSLSFSETPFAEGGPDTMPELHDLATKQGLVFTRAYSPGPSSPSSHGALFTGELPSAVGMHEATPFFSSDPPTIAGELGDTHRSFLVSTNPFIFNGLDRDFDETENLRNKQYMLFQGANDPLEFTMRYDSKSQQWIRFCLDGGTPVRSFLNGVSYKLWERKQSGAIPRDLSDEETDYQYVRTTNEKIRSFLDSHSGDSLVVANYMDVHPPFDASDQAVDRFAAGEARTDLPIGVSGQEVLRRARNGDDETVERMMKLYRATIWDTDRKLTPFIQDLLDDGTHVIVTADHGNWFRRNQHFETDLIHVPLIVFSPGDGPARISETVNNRDIAATTMDVLDREHDLGGESLRGVTEDRLSITESIHEPKGNSPVDAHADAGEVTAQYDVTAIHGDVRVEYVDGRYKTISGDEEAASELQTTIEDLVSRGLQSGRGESIEYDEVTEQRLEDLGYVD